MTDLIFATHNKNKVTEVRSLLNEKFGIRSLSELSMHDDIPEPFDTLEENAREKARVIQKRTGRDCFSEDTGLEVAALDGAPGVKSARYAGAQKDSEANIDLLLANLSNCQNRKARFRTVIYLIFKSKEYIFEGICPGHISVERKGTLGFGYDSVFIPEPSTFTFAEMELSEKNKFSHRKKAMNRLVLFLNEQNVIKER